MPAEGKRTPDIIQRGTAGQIPPPIDDIDAFCPPHLSPAHIV
jgi:hypothetical protein